MRVSRVSRSRISGIVAARNHIVRSVHGVEKAQASFAVENDTSDTSPNFFLSKETFYDLMEERNRQHTDFEGQLAEDELNRRKDSLFDLSEDNILSFIETAILQFNQAMDYVKKLDISKRQKSLDTIVHTVTSHNRPLSNLGIISDRNLHMNINREKFLLTVSKSPHHLKLLLDPEKGILRKIHDSFMEVLS